MLGHWKTLVEIVLIIFSFILCLILLLPTSILFIIFQAWKIFVSRVLVRICSKKFARMMGGNNPVVALDDLYVRPLSTIVGMGAFDGRLDLATIRSYVLNTVNATTSTGELVNPEFSQYYEEWMGYLWWNWELDFKIDDHVKSWKPEDNSRAIDEDSLMEFFAFLECRPFQERKSPWEFFVIRNVRLRNVHDEAEPKTIMAFRIHHGICDGVAVMQMFMKYFFDDTFEKIPQPQRIRRNRFQEGANTIKIIAQAPYQCLKQAITASDTNEWHLRESKLKREIWKAWTKRIPIQLINETKIKHGNGLGFTAVLIAAITGALRLSMSNLDIKIPKEIHAVMPLPWPGHPPGMGNHWSYGFLALPVGTENRGQRLSRCKKYWDQLKMSTIPAVNFAILKIFNLLPTWLIRNGSLTTCFPTVLLSNFPGPPPGTNGIGGFPLVDACFTFGSLRNNIGISITVLSYDMHLRIVVGVDKAIFPKEDIAISLVRLIEDEFEYLSLEKPQTPYDKTV